ncbi:hypothetical protein [Chlorobaculum tepidum]|nr:hypothetical protein [Chlorobaculum tepidum]
MKQLMFVLLLLLFAGAASGSEGRIVSQSPYITDTLCALGLANRIAGVSRYGDLDLPKTGGVIDSDPAAIAALHPGSLFLSDWTSRDVCKRVRPAGAKCVVLQKEGYECPVRIPEGDYQIVRLDGLHFVSPSPKILEGLADLQWQFGSRNKKNESK